MNESEKVSINLGVVELAQIDVLVEQGIFSNRSDFIRTAIRKELEANSEKIERQFSPIGEGKHWRYQLGIVGISKRYLEEWALANKGKLSFTVIGMIIFESDISLDLFERTIGTVTIRGKLVASDEIKEAIKNRSL